MKLNTQKCSVCGTRAFDRLFIDYATGELACVACKGFGSEELPKTTVSALKILTNTEFEKLSTLKLSAGSENALLKILVKNFETRFDEKLKFIGVFD